MTFAYLDCFAGVAGDMVLGALLDAGGSVDALRAGLEGLPVDPFELEVTGVERAGSAPPTSGSGPSART